MGQGKQPCIKREKRKIKQKVRPYIDAWIKINCKYALLRKGWGWTTKFRIRYLIEAYVMVIEAHP